MQRCRRIRRDGGRSRSESGDAGFHFASRCRERGNRGHRENGCRFLVAFSGRYGATAGKAERSASVLRNSGFEVERDAIPSLEQLTKFDAIVMGGAVYHGSWLPEMTELVNRYATFLSFRPVWTFSVGRRGRRSGLPARLTWTDSSGLEELDRVVQPRGHRLLEGALQPAAMSEAQRALFRSLGGRFGDFRDWPRIDSWALSIRQSLITDRSVTKGR